MDWEASLPSPPNTVNRLDTGRVEEDKELILLTLSLY